MVRICCQSCVTLVLLFFVSGCGGDGRPSLVPASGTVTLNGEPLAEAQIGLQPMGIEGYERPSRATTDAQGKFTIGTYGADDGLPEGSYRVTVVKKELLTKIPEGFAGEDMSQLGPVKYKWIVPMQYSDPENSGLSVEVTASGMTPDVIALEGEAEVSGGVQANEP